MQTIALHADTFKSQNCLNPTLKNEIQSAFQDSGTLEPWVHEYGPVAIFLILTIESFGALLPGESLLIVAAILAGRGELTFPALLPQSSPGIFRFLYADITVLSVPCSRMDIGQSIILPQTGG